MRLTWLGTAAEGEGHRVRWRPRKRNERGFIPGFVLTFEYSNGRPITVQRDDDEGSTRDWLLSALLRGPRSMADLAEQIIEESERLTNADLERIKERLGQALFRMRRDDVVEKQGTTGLNVRWALRRTP